MGDVGATAERCCTPREARTEALTLGGDPEPTAAAATLAPVRYLLGGPEGSPKEAQPCKMGWWNMMGGSWGWWANARARGVVAAAA